MIERALTETIKRLSKAFPVIAILGPRQSGKTTLSKAIFNKHAYVSFEEVIEARIEAEKDPHGFFAKYKNEHGIILDEFQHVPMLLSYIQLYVDKERKPGHFILTGSQNFLMNQAITQTLAGRVAIINLLPLSIGELSKTHILPDSIEEYVFKGSYPELYVNPHMRPTDWYPNYTKTYLERDVRDIKRVENLSTFQRFMKLCAARTGQIMNYTSLSIDSDVTLPTVKAWLSLLEASYVIFFLQPYSTKLSRRLIKSPKLYFYDVGLASSLLGLESVEDVKLSPYRGNLVESLVISEIMKLYSNTSRIPRAYFLRDKTGHEVDCILEKAHTITALEIKAKHTAAMNLFDDLLFWQKLSIPIEQGYVIYAGSETQKRPYGTFLSWRDIEQLKESI